VGKDENQNVVVAGCEFKNGQVRVELRFDLNVKTTGLFVRPATSPRVLPQNDQLGNTLLLNLAEIKLLDKDYWKVFSRRSRLLSYPAIQRMLCD
jgi:hypothetical protein